MKIKCLLSIVMILFIGSQVKSQAYKELGTVAISTNPLMPIMKGIPVVLNIRTGPVIHDLRYATFWKHNNSNFYDVFNPLNEAVTFKVSKAMEAGYALKIPAKIVDETAFLVYVAPQYIYSSYQFSDVPVTYLIKGSGTQVDQVVAGEVKINRYMGVFGIMLMPKGGFFLDSYISLGMRKFKAGFNETVPGSDKEINSANVDFVKPEKIGEAFFGDAGRVSMQAGFRFGISF